MWDLLGPLVKVSNELTEWGGVICRRCSYKGRERTEGTAVVPPKKKTLCAREGISIWNDKLQL